MTIAPGRAPASRARRLAHAQEWPGYIDIESARAQGRQRGPLQRRRLGHPSVVDEHVDGAEVLETVWTTCSSSVTSQTCGAHVFQLVQPRRRVLGPRRHRREPRSARRWPGRCPWRRRSRPRCGSSGAITAEPLHLGHALRVSDRRETAEPRVPRRRRRTRPGIGDLFRCATEPVRLLLDRLGSSPSTDRQQLQLDRIWIAPSLMALDVLVALCQLLRASRGRSRGTTRRHIGPRGAGLPGLSPPHHIGTLPLGWKAMSS